MGRDPEIKSPPHTLYAQDETMVGLHMAEVKKPIRALHRLVGVGHVAAADTQQQMMKLGTHTGKALAHVLAR